MLLVRDERDDALDELTHTLDNNEEEEALTRVKEIVDDAPIVKFVNLLIAQGIADRASIALHTAYMSTAPRSRAAGSPMRPWAVETNNHLRSARSWPTSRVARGEASTARMAGRETSAVTLDIGLCTCSI